MASRSRSLSPLYVEITAEPAPAIPSIFFVTPGGFRMYNCPLYTVLFAEVPADGTNLGFSINGRTIGAPGWMSLEDIDARLEEADLPAWQNPTLQKGMFPTLLEALLAERCKLVAHRELRGQQVYDLVIAKNGPKLQRAAFNQSVDIAKSHSTLPTL